MVVVVCMNDEDGWSSHAKEASARPDIGLGAGPATSMPSRKRFVTFLLLIILIIKYSLFNLLKLLFISYYLY